MALIKYIVSGFLNLQSTNIIHYIITFATLPIKKKQSTEVENTHLLYSQKLGNKKFKSLMLTGSRRSQFLPVKEKEHENLALIKKKNIYLNIPVKSMIHLSEF